MRLAYIWDYEIDEAQFEAMLDGKLSIGRLDRDWAAVRLIEYASYPEIIHRLGFRRLIEGWPRWREKIRSQSRKRGFDFLVDWLPAHYPGMLK